jgi:transposase
MARYKDYCYSQTKLIPVSFSEQILPGTFEYTLNYLIDNEVDLSIFEARYCNDETGAPAYDPAILLKIILYAYSRGIIYSREIERCCRENIIFMALAADTQPHFTTIADFISSMDKEITGLFRDVLMICDEMGLIGKEMFAIDGCKLPSNASKEWSGTRADFQKKTKKMEKAIRYLLNKHRDMDAEQLNPQAIAPQSQQIKTLREKIKKIKRWLAHNEDRPGKTGKPKKSNITDNDSAKITTSHGVIQGYDGVATVDSKHQVIVHARAYGEAQEHALLMPMVEATREHFKAIGAEDDIFGEAKLSADSGLHTERNMQRLFTEGIDGYVADRLFRKRDPRFLAASRHKPKKQENKDRLFQPSDFIFDPATLSCICPAGNRLYRSGTVVVINNYRASRFRGAKTRCLPCHLRSKCLKHPERTQARQVAFFAGRDPAAKETYTQKIKRKIDSEEGRHQYARRLGIVEPVFANIASTLGLNRFTLRGKHKVNTQWVLYCIVHNLGKIHRYAPGFT